MATAHTGMLITLVLRTSNAIWRPGRRLGGYSVIHCRVGGEVGRHQPAAPACRGWRRDRKAIIVNEKNGRHITRQG